MTIDVTNAYTPHQRRARAVYRSIATKRPQVGILAAELAVLAVMMLVAAGLVALRTWLMMPN
ncbi:hypothetical protein [Bosea caraganae]|nr:hypothetical protein [Bosea caraganae]